MESNAFGRLVVGLLLSLSCSGQYIDWIKQTKNKPFVDVREYGAKGDSTTDDTTAIQNAINSCTTGCTIYFPVGKYVVSSRIILKPGVTLQGDGMFGGPGEESITVSTLYIKNTHPGPVIDISADNLIGYAHIRGVALNNLTIDVTRRPQVSPVIKIRSLSNAPTWNNVTIFGTAATALDIRVSVAGAPDNVSEGLVFNNLYIYALYANPGTYAGNPVAELVHIESSNEVTFRDGKFLSAKYYSGTYPMVLITTNGTSQPGFSVTFDKLATSNYANHYKFQAVGNSSGGWLRFLSATLENYNKGILINQDSGVTFHTRNLLVDAGTRFFAEQGATPIKLKADWVENGYIYHDRWDQTSVVTLDSNTRGLVVVGPLDLVSNAGYNVVQAPYYYGNRLDSQSNVRITSTSPQLEVLESGSSVNAAVLASSSVGGYGYFGTKSNHITSIGANNIGKFICSPVVGEGCGTVDFPFFVKNNSSVTKFEVDATTGKTNQFSEAVNPTLSILQANGANSGNYIRFADVNIGGQPLNAAYLKWERDSASGRKFAICTANNAGVSGCGVEVTYDYGLRLTPPGARPTCSSSLRGTFWVENSGAGVKDTVTVCAKDAGDAYAWRVIY